MRSLRLCAPLLLLIDDDALGFLELLEADGFCDSEGPASGSDATKSARFCAAWSFFAGRRLLLEPGFSTRAEARALETKSECLIIRLSRFKAGRPSSFEMLESDGFDCGRARPAVDDFAMFCALLATSRVFLRLLKRRGAIS